MTHKTRNEILEVLVALETNEIAYDDTEAKRDDIQILWGKIARLNCGLGIKHPESGERYKIYPEGTEIPAHRRKRGKSQPIEIQYYESQYRTEEPYDTYDIDDFYY